MHNYHIRIFIGSTFKINNITNADMDLNLFLRKRINRLKEMKLGLRYYSLTGYEHLSRKICISMVDGRFAHGGLSDRLKGAISLFAYCKASRQEFRLNFSSPFNLTDYLHPNRYDWQIKKDEVISYNFWNTRVLILTSEYTGERLLNLHTTKQLHYYNNLDIIDAINQKYGTKYTYGELFDELFIPAPDLSYRINEHTTKIGGKYIAIVFRFQQLLGDFKEYDFPKLEVDKRLELMEKCRNAVVSLSEKYPDKICLVTSDSCTFLDYISGIKNVYVLPGKVVHVDVVRGAGYLEYLKSFLDLYMIAGAEIVFCVGTKDMYPSEFPMYAAKIRNIPFHRILI